MKEKFAKPEIEIVTFEAEDIIQTSGCTKDGCLLNCTNKDQF